MKKLLNTIYVTNPDSYLSLDGDNLVVMRGGYLQKMLGTME